MLNRAGLVLVGTVASVCAAQEVAPAPARTAEAVEAMAEREVGAVFDAAGVEPRRIVLLGTFHFKDAGLDEYKPTHSFDALSERRQKEIGEVVDRLDGFDADVVCVERRPEWDERLAQEYGSYRAGGFELPPNEIYQLGFRLAEREGLEGVAPVDAEARWFADRQDVEDWAQANGQAGRLMSPYMRPGYAYLQQLDKRVDEWHLIDTLLYRNAEPLLEASHGMYLTGGFAVGDGEVYPGTDGFVSAWHTRNLRIFSNIIRATEPGDRVVVIIGAGHVPLLRQMAEASPEFELVEVHEVLGDG